MAEGKTVDLIDPMEVKKINAMECAANFATQLEVAAKAMESMEDSFDDCESFAYAEFDPFRENFQTVKDELCRLKQVADEFDFQANDLLPSGKWEKVNGIGYWYDKTLPFFTMANDASTNMVNLTEESVEMYARHVIIIFILFCL